MVLKVQSRRMVSNSQQRYMEKQRAYRNKDFGSKLPNEGEIPEFSNLLKQFYKRAHPDILRAHNPKIAEFNDNSFQQLNEILSAIKEINSFPPMMSKTITFYLRRNVERISASIISNSIHEFSQIDLKVKLAGGDCRKSLHHSFQHFFESAGVLTSRNVKFKWGKDYFPEEDSSGSI
jgi:hypothetical protein